MQIASIIIISIIGTLSHFLYDISGHNKFVGLFTAVNESTWEHIKIALTPTFLWSLVDGYMYGANPNYFLAKLTSVIVIIITIPLLFYGYKIFFKKDNVLFNVLIFYIAIILSQLSFYYVLNMNYNGYIANYISVILLALIFIGYLSHTIFPGKSFIFKDPLTNKFGYKAHK
ncbi:MAG: hypothetical protein IJ715_01515 [Bacilli bacterium]|nr:hypothetical protein [Bacilli bacterium]